MSSDETGETAEARRRREALREKAQQVKARQARNRVLRRAAIVLGVVAVVAAVAFAVTNAVVPTLSKPTLNPANMQDDGVVLDETVVGADDDDEADEAEAQTNAAPAVEIHVYVDYLSEASGVFQRTNAAQLKEWVEQGAVSLVYHPVALLTSKSNGTKYSQRAAGAAACVWEHAPEAFIAYNHELLTNQPSPDSDGYSDAELADRAIAVGAANTQVVRACIENEDYFSWAREATERALTEPLPGTDDVTLSGAPMILVNGQSYVGSLERAEEFSQFVLNVSSDAYLRTATPTPSPAPTPTDEPPAPTPTDGE
ncbi:DsbA family protein [Microbacterium album]|uniref:Thioredoxin-like fold domain-containing protein n=1 Tax=Microbacterium album TaxID=2053191 RepID=A0A917IH89_9MICO|nr:thioredoxin domain-containing protein [Microbacterium album]GGH43731.1 hypothetical protein GCM10010921_17900 [Microbacterium album]